ncbi:heme-binding protein [Ktedonosporobacter rubrisoli]|uniref:Heme-binding protein n=1 Tax=Ktedonosporobacter rubrisoli TaxID=2509675 RepID=A0A4P6JHR0_KTERU|nr:heme-binding protein [Ktedonosporobacter rubrisoli]QBD74569.1 heme-binding protein [Ktedonosporobacter rubrisoli]
MAHKLETRPVLTLAVAKLIAAAAEEKALKHGLSVAIAILSDSGKLLYFQRMDNTSNASVDIALAKAQHSVNFHRPTKYHEDLVSGGNNIVLGVPGMVPLEGGLPIRVDGYVVGSIGVSGAKSSEDGEIAEAGVQALQAYLAG